MQIILFPFAGAHRPDQAIAVDVFDKFFGKGVDGIVHTTLSILEERFSFHHT